MRNDPPEDGTDTEPVVEMRRRADAPHGNGDERQALRNRRAADAETMPEVSQLEDTDDAPDLLCAISDSLLVAYSLARQEGDPLIVALIGKALMHTGRRLASGMSPAEAGIACH